jgi:hypothetical protein
MIWTAAVALLLIVAVLAFPTLARLVGAVVLILIVITVAASPRGGAYAAAASRRGLFAGL